MGQGQSGQAGFPGQGQQGEKKDQVCKYRYRQMHVSDVACSKAVIGVIRWPITIAFAISFESQSHTVATHIFKASDPLYLPSVYTAKGEEKMGASSATTTCREEATAGGPGKRVTASRTVCWSSSCCGQSKASSQRQSSYHVSFA